MKNLFTYVKKMSFFFLFATNLAHRVLWSGTNFNCEKLVLYFILSFINQFCISFNIKSQTPVASSENTRTHTQSHTDFNICRKTRIRPPPTTIKILSNVLKVRIVQLSTKICFSVSGNTVILFSTFFFGRFEFKKIEYG